MSAERHVGENTPIARISVIFQTTQTSEKIEQPRISNFALMDKEREKSFDYHQYRPYYSEDEDSDYEREKEENDEYERRREEEEYEWQQDRENRGEN